MNRRAHEELHAYGEHQQERGDNYETPNTTDSTASLGMPDNTYAKSGDGNG